ncbi:MAG: hypothetical protein IPN36_16920 [Bacteroidetes bacterium]|nr:hypothetical protein [Bacteroidota bacterium]
MFHILQRLGVVCLLSIPTGPLLRSICKYFPGTSPFSMSTFSTPVYKMAFSGLSKTHVHCSVADFCALTLQEIIRNRRM